ncbi:MAG: decarboxylating 6-phosphogluconate dehydrogenase [SAR202 cluster bacterium]|nr:decarboxylating 6-phosphogluconate dehydrogenase [SAR202 cluster bacterium]|tara:strand:- start:917 stop:1825 length:909 start_codon:yes stop_codon:yes gene_type:complete
MEIGIIGLGRMGGSMAQRLLKGGHRVVAYDLRPEAVKELEGEGAAGASSLADLAGQLTTPRAVWVMAPAGEATERTLTALAGALSEGDVIIDGGNANYKDSIRRAAMLKEKGLDFLDAGTSGGIWGLTEGYSLMIGGDKKAFERVEPIFQTLAPSPTTGYGHVGPAGAGHFTKMVHNGIEYGMMQAYAEGLELMHAKEALNLDLAQITEIWRYGSVVRSWLLDLTADALKEDPEMSTLEPYVDDSGEGRWTVEESIDLAVPTPVMTLALQMRFRSRQDDSFSAKLLAAMRNQFGGHAVKKAE